MYIYVLIIVLQINIQSKDKDQKTVTQEIQILIEQIKIIFQKLNDPNYVCENFDCRLLRENSINHEINKNVNNEILKEANNESKNQQKIKIPGETRPLIKKFKIDPKCKEIMQNQLNDKKIFKLFNYESQCDTCSLVKKYNDQKNYLYINYGGCILEINCSNKS